MASVNSQPPVLLEKVFEVVRNKLPKTTAELVEEFTKRLYRNVANDEIIGRDHSNIYGAVVSLWHSFNDYHADKKAQIRVYNPEVTKHGWESPNTVIEVIQTDMPFMVDSVRMALNRFGIQAHLFLNAPLAHKRDKEGNIESIVEEGKTDKNAQTDTVFLIEIDRQSSTEDLKALKDELTSVMSEVYAAVTDWQPMKKKLKEISQSLDERNFPGSKTELEQSKAFLTWLANDNFTLMGYRSYVVDAVEGDYEVRQVEGTSLGLMRNTVTDKPRRLADLPKLARHAALSSDEILLLTKTNTKSRVHRPAYTDYIGIKRFDKNGNVIGEDRFIGLYSASFYNDSAMDIPMVREKIKSILDKSKYGPTSHASKALLNILQTYPRDEIVQSKESELLDIALGILQIQERDITRVFLRRDIFGRFITAMVYVPKERYNTALRQQTQQILARTLGATGDVDFTTYFSESALARTQYSVRVTDSGQDINVKELEQNLTEASRSWEDNLESQLVAAHGEAKARSIVKRYAHGFPRAYKEDVLPSVALADIAQLEALNDEHKLGMLFYRAQEVQDDSNRVKLKLFHKDEPIHLSDVLPMLENFGLRVINESPYQIKTHEGNVFWILDFFMVHTSGPLDLEKTRDNFQDAFGRVWTGDYEDDGFNRLVLGAGMTGRHVIILRMFAKYMRQIGVTFSQSYIESAFTRYPKIGKLLVKLFYTKFEPGVKGVEKKIDAILQRIQTELDNVVSLDDDRIMGRYVDLIKAALRTNFFQKTEEGIEKNYISVKFAPENIPEMPLPLPKYEIFVYSPRVEGVHLRGGKVARGGLRWSDRREDFRTEVLGLVKAQQVKNTVIVPVGAKGGFVCKQLPEERDEMFAEGQACYKTFIRGLLDITDNILEGEVIPARDVVAHDEVDYYLVVAADKGTATFSDIANGISEEYNFWLGDAFASGGSVGYDHKKMGITAKGAWESVKRHFREMDIDCQTTDFTCVAIGDMAGDVFGNGMLASKHTKLVGAFNHMHIFIDPDPDPAKSYKERERLFNLPRSSWTDYDTSLISEGGGIFNRSAKSIELTTEMKKLLGTQKRSMTPNELIRALLLAEVDLIWNGGIGTYVKSTKETDIEVGDRANDMLRVNGKDLRTKIIGEGGNLGFTQLGRIEYASRGGRVNTDFIDNVGGVDCSDNEVNIKILLNGLVNQGKLTRKQRDQLLYDMTDDVSRIVLEDCARQTLSLSVTQLRGADQVKEMQRFIHHLEREGQLDRALEFLPDDDELADRVASGKGLTRPELSVISAYGKMVLKESLAIDDIAKDPFHAKELAMAFPEKLREKFLADMEEHPLRTEIIATKLANNIVNDMGPNFVQRKQEATGATVAEVAAAYIISREVFDAHKLRDQVVALDNKVSADVQNRILFQVRRMVRRTTRWFLRHKNPAFTTIQENIDFYKKAFDDLRKNALSYLNDKEAQEIQKEIDGYTEKGVPKKLAEQIGLLSTIFSAMDIAEIAESTSQKISTVSEIYFRLGADIQLHWFLQQVNGQPVANHWQALARAAFREELDWQQRSLATTVLKLSDETKDPSKMLELWYEKNDQYVDRWKTMLADFKTTKSHEFAKFSVALRELMLLSHNCGS
ncbi:MULTISPECIES: NAD-glutamate dehydrogenase [Gammaproteobacteria]|uniref:NAD-glutamate dehydrogenase n=1 Tax=Gammaproteobacteria TaxID=1236 RepID=UPI000DD03578|nr:MULTISPECIES: NAD-glutamate dehydrogenase [Gammaproteobacteria]RTE87215.1 NAD-glutamate dehydrogenase [Aliidiomarina sp. B3213]TCZ92997.1 NAD-glutamate dehydrogenase [Lysobacter sp. N42]